MKRMLVFAGLFAGACLAQQNAPPAPQGNAPQGRGGGGGAALNLERTNEQSGVDIDRFIGLPDNSPVHLSHGTLLYHTILRNGDPYTPGPRGAVLEYRRDLSVATLLGKNKTPLVTLPEQHFFYVKGGEGRLDDGKQMWDLRDGISVLVPPNAPHRFTNTSDKTLTMIMLRWTAAGTPSSDILVRDVNLLSYCEENAHWHNTTKCIFGAADGLFQNERMYLVMLQPWAMSAPHPHGPGTEEVWTKVTPGTSTMLLGSEIREMPENSAYLVPPTGITIHANLNLSKEKVEWWLYVARGAGQGGRGGGVQTTGGPAPGATAAAANAASPNEASAQTATVPAGGRGGGGRGGARNPNLSRDTKEANVAGRPLR